MEQSGYCSEHLFVELTFQKEVWQEKERIAKQGETIRFLPAFIPSCMEIGKEKVCPVEVSYHTEKNGKRKIRVKDYRREIEVWEDEVSIQTGEYVREIEKTGCIPCRNCGRC